MITKFDKFIIESIEIDKNIIDNINSIDSFVYTVNNMNKTPQRGFSYKPKSAIKLNPKTLIFHSTTKENIESIVVNGFHGVCAYYSSFTKTRKSKEYVKNGIFGFGFDLSNKKIDSRFQKDFLYGSWGLIFYSNSACKVYNSGDKQYQVVFDVTSNIDILCVVNVKVDKDNLKEFIWDIYDKNFNLVEKDVKLSEYLKNIK